MFPSLDSVEPKPKEPAKKEETAKKKEEGAKKEEEKQVETPWWQKINQPKKAEVDEEEPAKVRSRKGKKEKWVSVKGIFN